MISGIYNFTIEQGTTFQRLIRVTNPDGTVFDLSDYEARMHIRREIDSATIMLELTTENGRLSIDGPEGEISILVDAEDTEAVHQNGVYDLEIVNGSTVYRLLRGAVTANLEVTR